MSITDHYCGQTQPHEAVTFMVDGDPYGLVYETEADVRALARIMGWSEVTYWARFRRYRAG